MRAECLCRRVFCAVSDSFIHPCADLSESVFQNGDASAVLCCIKRDHKPDHEERNNALNCGNPAPQVIAFPTFPA